MHLSKKIFEMNWARDIPSQGARKRSKSEQTYWWRSSNRGNAWPAMVSSSLLV